MADNIQLPASSEDGAILSTDDLGAGLQVQRVKIQFGADGSATDVSSAAPLPVTAASLPLPSGAATAANQTTANASLAAIETAVEGTLAVSAASLPLPSGAATSAAQSTQTTALQAIQTAVEALDNAVSGSELQVDLVGSVPAGSNEIGRVRITDGTDLASVTAAGRLEVDGSGVTQPVSGTVAATQSGTWGVRCQDGSGNALTSKSAGSERAMSVAIVDGSGTHITSFGGGTQYTEGDTDASITGTAMLWEDSGNTLRAVAAGTPLPVAIISGAGSGGTAIADGAAFTADTTSLTPIGGYRDDTSPATVTEGDAAAARITEYRALHVNLRDASGSEVSVGGGTQYDEDTASAAAEKVTMAGVVRSDTAASKVSDDGDRTVLLVDSSGRLHVNVGNTVTVGSHAVTNAGTFATQAAQSGTWNITNVSGTVSLPTGASTAAKQPALGTAGSASADVISVQGIASMTPLLVNGSGVTQPVSGTVTVQDGGNTITVDNGGTFAVQADTELTTADLDTGGGTDTRAVVGLVGSASGGGQLIPGSSTDGLLVNLGANNDVTVTGSVTANAGTNLNTSALALESGGNLAAAATSLGLLDNAVSGNELQVDIVAALPAGTNNIGDVDVLTLPNVTLASTTNTIEVVGDAAAGAAVSGNPVLVGFRADTTVPAAVDDGDVVHPWTDEYGAQVVKPSCNQIDISVTPTIDTAVYASGDRLGSVMTFSNAALASGRSGTIVSALLFDDANSSFDVRLHLFKVSPTLANADNGALEFTDANLATAIPIGVIEFDTDNQHTYVNNRIVQGTWLGGPVALPFVTSGSSSIFGVLEARGAYDAAATDDLVVTLTVIRD